MARKGKAQATRPIPDWATLRPPVTEALLADITQRIVEKFQPFKVILFGSYAYGTPDLDSDVDLLVVMDSDEPMAQRIIPFVILSAMCREVSQGVSHCAGQHAATYS